MKSLKINIIILIIICLTVLYISLKDDFMGVVRQLYEVNIWWFFLGCLLMLLYFMFRALALQDLVHTVKKNYPYRKSLGIVVLGQFFANITPSSAGGQPAQVYFLRKDKVRASHGTSIVLQYNMIYQLALLMVGLITIVLAYSFNVFGNASFIFRELVMISFLIHFGVLMIYIAIIYSKDINKFIINSTIKILAFFKIIKDKEKTLNDWDLHLDNFHNGSQNLLEDRAMLMKAIFYNVMALICFYSIPLLLIYAIGDFDNLKFMVTNIASSYTNMISVFIPSPGGTGAFEYFFIRFFGVFVTGATLTTLMLLWRFVTYYFVILVGTIILFFSKEGNVE